jgi:predicted nuclease of predicted toxin-antitoxin system
MNAVQTFRFLVDGTLGSDLAPGLRACGHDAMEIFALGLAGRLNNDVLAAAWNERRILLTQDRAFLDDERFDGDRTPGIVVLPASNGHALTMPLVYALSTVRIAVPLSEGAKILVTEDGRFSLTARNHETGSIETAHYKLCKDAPPLIWAVMNWTGVR